MTLEADGNMHASHGSEEGRDKISRGVFFGGGWGGGPGDRNGLELETRAFRLSGSLRKTNKYFLFLFFFKSPEGFFPFTSSLSPPCL